MPDRAIYALTSFTVELRRGGWFFGDTYSQEKSQFRGPYTSLASVTLMIAREMQREVSRRHARLMGNQAA